MTIQNNQIKKIDRTRNRLRRIKPQVAVAKTSFVTVMLTLILVFVSLVSIFEISGPSQFTQTLTQLSSLPFASSLHLRLAGLYLAANQLSTAKEELVVANALIDKDQSQKVAYEQLAYQIFDAPKIQQQQIKFWQQQAQLYPDYTDAWIQQLYLSFLQNDANLVNRSMAEITKLDPNLAAKITQILKLKNDN